MHGPGFSVWAGAGGHFAGLAFALGVSPVVFGDGGHTGERFAGGARLAWRDGGTHLTRAFPINMPAIRTLRPLWCGGRWAEFLQAEFFSCY